MGLEAALVNNGESSLGLEEEELQQQDHDEQVNEPDDQDSDHAYDDYNDDAHSDSVEDDCNSLASIGGSSIDLEQGYDNN